MHTLLNFCKVHSHKSSHLSDLSVLISHCSHWDSGDRLNVYVLIRLLMVICTHCGHIDGQYDLFSQD